MAKVKGELLWVQQVLMRFPRKSMMQLIDGNLYRETWKTSLSTHPSWRDISPKFLRVMVLYHYVHTHLDFIFIFAHCHFDFNTRTYRNNYIQLSTGRQSILYSHFRSPVCHDTFFTDKVHFSYAYQVTFCIIQLSPFHFILKIFWHVDNCISYDPNERYMYHMWDWRSLFPPPFVVSWEPISKRIYLLTTNII